MDDETRKAINKLRRQLTETVRNQGFILQALDELSDENIAQRRQLDNLTKLIQYMIDIQQHNYADLLKRISNQNTDD